MREGVRRASAEVSRDRPPQGTPASWFEQATVTTVSAGAAADGNALVTVTWRGSPVQAAYLSSYAPTVSHNVLVLVQPPSLLILGRVIGTP